MYNPNPIDTSKITLSSEIQSLAEQLAENTHDVWAAGRIKDGWTYGPVRNDAEKTHPCLIPYNELSDSEKEYDRATALETLKLISKLGFSITKRKRKWWK